MNRAQWPILVVALFVLCLGAFQLFARPTLAGNCPSGGGCGCSTAYAPVVCKGCRYTNMCHARCAGFDSKQCKDVSN
jgi:hypothetical protein